MSFWKKSLSFWKISLSFSRSLSFFGLEFFSKCPKKKPDLSDPTIFQDPRGYTKLNCRRPTGPSTRTSAWTPPPSRRVTTKTIGTCERHPWKKAPSPANFLQIGLFAQRGFLSIAFYYFAAALSKRGSFEIHHQSYFLVRRVSPRPTIVACYCHA